MTIALALATNSPPEWSRAAELFAIRADELAERVWRGQLGCIDAVDMAYSAAQWSGLSDEIGDDSVQAIMAAAFTATRKDNK